MNKMLFFLLKAILWLIVGIGVVLLSIAFVIGCCEGDFSHGLGYYL